jgi:ABC-type transport system involved in multi-copper enzyme maturation permease subunit
MWNIIKAQNYQLKRDNLVIIVLLLGLLVSACEILSLASEGTLTGCDYVLGTSEYAVMIYLLVPLVLTCRICGGDYGDKTMNYEILAGHSRKQVYWGRVISAIIWSMVVSLIVLFLPMLLCTAIGGWGDSMDFGGIMLRYGLMIFVLFRMECIFALLTFLLKNGYMGILVGYMFFLTEMGGAMLYEEFADKELTVQFVSIHLMKLFNFSKYSMEYINGKDVVFYSTEFTSDFVIGSIIVSILVGMACLLIGYQVFKRRDMQ